MYVRVYVSESDLAITVPGFVTQAVGRKLPVIKRLAHACLRVPSASGITGKETLGFTSTETIKDY